MINSQFDRDYLVGGYLKRQERTHRYPLQRLRISQEEMATLCQCRNNFSTCAERIGELAKTSFLRDSKDPSLPLISLAQRVKYITAHVYDGTTILWEEEEKTVVDVLNKAIYRKTEELVDNLRLNENAPSFTDDLQNRQQMEKLYQDQIASQKMAITSLSSYENPGLNPIKQLSAWWDLSQKLPKQKKTLEATRHTSKIFIRALGPLSLYQTSLHQIRTQPTSHFQIILQPKNGCVGKHYTSLFVSFIPKKSPQNPSTPSACVPLNDATFFIKNSGSSGKLVPTHRERRLVLMKNKMC
jgi:hypothetical protein